MSADVIFLFRVKTIDFAIVPPRLVAVDKCPKKSAELKLASPRWRLAAAGDPLAGLDENKFAPRARRGGKLRLFRVWKLYGELKADGAAPADYRDVGERLRAQRWLRRL
jgi:hypothetical protein